MIEFILIGLAGFSSLQGLHVGVARKIISASVRAIICLIEFPLCFISKTS